MTEPIARVDVIDIDDTLGSLALRSVLECWGVRVSAHWVGMAKDVVRLLGGQENLSEIVVLMCHGNNGEMALPVLHPSVEKKQPYHGALTPQDLGQFLKLPGRIVLNTGCSLGAAPFARAFLDAGCKAYVGATGDPEGAASLFYGLHLFYGLFCRRLSLRAAHELARSHGSETRYYRLYERGTPDRGTHKGRRQQEHRFQQLE
jgi:hypothetical protein